MIGFLSTLELESRHTQAIDFAVSLLKLELISSNFASIVIKSIDTVTQRQLAGSSSLLFCRR